jgi:hypothetical protein
MARFVLSGYVIIMETVSFEKSHLKVSDEESNSLIMEFVWGIK